MNVLIYVYLMKQVYRIILFLAGRLEADRKYSVSFYIVKRRMTLNLFY